MKRMNKIFVIAGSLGFTVATMQCADGISQPDAGNQIGLQINSDSSLGTVTSDVGGIDCGTVCAVTVDPNTTVTLTATPVGQAKFLGWGGDCSGTQPTCTLTVDQSKSVNANWKMPDPPDMATPPDMAQLPAPTLTAVTPPYAPNNTTTNITITGANFQAGATVTVAGQTCSNPSVVSSTQITCTVPKKTATCGPQAVVVTNPDTKNAAKNLFAYRAASVAFATPVVLTGTQAGPHRMVLADFNNDGNIDIAHSNQNSNSVSVYLGSAAGAFGAAKNASVGNQPIGIAYGDLNKDGNLDLVVGNSGDGSISFLAGDGKGGFATAVNTMGFGGPQGVAIADIDQDMNLDVAVVNPGLSQVHILKGDGKGGLTMGTPVSVTNSARFLALADVTGDKYPDLLVPNPNAKTVSYRPNKADGTLTFAAGSDISVGTDAYEVVVADVNNDQNPDFLFTASNGNAVGVFTGNGKGTFLAATGSPFAVGSFPAFMSVADVNGDGKPDFVTANQSSSNLSILAGNGTGGFAAVTGNPFAAGNGPTGVGAADFNGDSLIDIANSNYFAGTAQVRLAICN